MSMEGELTFVLWCISNYLYLEGKVCMLFDSASKPSLVTVLLFFQPVIGDLLPVYAVILKVLALILLKMSLELGEEHNMNEISIFFCDPGGGDINTSILSKEDGSCSSASYLQPINALVFYVSKKIFSAESLKDLSAILISLKPMFETPWEVPWIEPTILSFILAAIHKTDYYMLENLHKIQVAVISSIAKKHFGTISIMRPTGQEYENFLYFGQVDNLRVELVHSTREISGTSFIHHHVGDTYGTSISEVLQK
uniref:Uncharacterized protein n=2 Tax=Nicotiana TaxID=4085 RepID=A0A1S4BQB5_TOBAC|nr:PREDICTED: uncharacterized protein LOC104222154 [Nicotiana sylvestris]XP_016490988.1 PREDICTED: uncharacterized protein LOC107810698 [Nicotiana tabacum]